MDHFEEQNVGDKSFFLSITGHEMSVVMAGLMMFEQSMKAGEVQDERALKACTDVQVKMLEVTKAEANRSSL